MTATCPICGSTHACPCHACRARELPGQINTHYGFRSGRNGKSDVICCPTCGFSGPVNEWEMKNDE